MLEYLLEMAKAPSAGGEGDAKSIVASPFVQACHHENQCHVSLVDRRCTQVSGSTKLCFAVKPDYDCAYQFRVRARSALGLGEYSAVVTQNPSGTGMPAASSSPRLAALPPAIVRDPRPSPASPTTNVPAGAVTAASVIPGR